ncbi:hypothetical protein LCGC14_1570160 [marine sediment metagenome]|uniref:DUF1508 domain-containing protein n=1 Tax=marine sediment metagenome TaxID=412755 RepID=A0A0F9L119_9ZZZZ
MGNLEIWVHKNSDLKHFWQLYKDGKPLARSPVNYTRKSDAKRRADRFLAAIGLIGFWEKGPWEKEKEG